MRGSSILCCLAASAPATLAAAGNANSLAQFALQKVLQDSREVFGDYYYTAAPNSSSSEQKFANWMSALPDSTPLSHINIPGTHDAATWNYTQATQDALRNATRCDGTTAAPAPVYRCQRESIARALDKGIRFFDLRFAADPLGQRLVFWHSAALVSATAGVADVMFGVWEWLARHESETVLLSFQHESGTTANATFDARVQGLMREALTGPGADEGRVWQGRGYVPTLAETRGKVVLVRRFDMDGDNDAGDGKGELPGLHMSPAKWNDNDPAGFALVYNETTNATAYIEDYYEPDALGENSTVASNIDAKMGAVKANLQRAASGDRDSLFITFASAEHDSNTPPVVPETMALGNGTQVTPDGGVNHQLVDVLKGLKGKRLGVVVLDFFDEPEDLVALVLGDQV